MNFFQLIYIAQEEDKVTSTSFISVTNKMRSSTVIYRYKYGKKRYKDLARIDVVEKKSDTKLGYEAGKVFYYVNLDLLYMKGDPIEEYRYTHFNRKKK
jgi:hypothetical protein